MRETRRAQQGDLPALLALYRHLNPDMPTLSEARATEIWNETLSRDGVTVLVTTVERRIVASCLLATVPNLMRGGAPYALIENVVTHADFRRQGHGRATIETALQMAWDEGCQQVMLLTGRGRRDPGVPAFYESCGFEQGVKTGFVARRPAGTEPAGAAAQIDSAGLLR